jgi:hypothetical protein
MFEYTSDYTSDYTFHQSGRLGNDSVDNTQRTLQNTQYLNSVLSHYSTSDKSSISYVDFATQIPGMMVSGMNGGNGLGGNSVEHESELFWKTQNERSLEKLQLYERPFLTIPFMGRGSVDPTLESQLMQGENVRGKKSVSTVMEQNFNPLDKYPLDSEKKASFGNTIEELALEGWTRGGKSARDMQENSFSKMSKPSNSGY